jgi:hypothetical protein
MRCSCAVSIEKFITNVSLSVHCPVAMFVELTLRLPTSQCQRVNAGEVTLDELDKSYPTIKNTITSGAILEAGRISLNERRTVTISIEGDRWSLA